MADSPSAGGSGLIPERLFEPQQPQAPSATTTASSSPSAAGSPTIPPRFFTEEAQNLYDQLRRLASAAMPEAPLEEVRPTRQRESQARQAQPTSTPTILYASPFGEDSTRSGIFDPDKELRAVAPSTEETGGVGALCAMSVSRTNLQGLYELADRHLTRSLTDALIMDHIFGSKLEAVQFNSPGFQHLGTLPAFSDLQGRLYYIGNYPGEDRSTLSVRIPTGEGTRDLDFPRTDVTLVLQPRGVPVFPFAWDYTRGAIVLRSRSEATARLPSVSQLPREAEFVVLETGSHREASASVRVKALGEEGRVLVKAMDLLREGYSADVTELFESAIKNGYNRRSLLRLVQYLHYDWAKKLAQRSLRGFDARLIFIDEAAWVSPRMYTAGIWPVAQQRFTCTILTTTPGDEQSYIMQQAKKRDIHDDPVMPCLLLGDPCADCKAKNDYLCKHNEHTAPWKSNANRERFAPFYENDADTNAKENYNATLETANYGFLPEYVERLARRPRWKDVKRPRYVTITVDAAHGGKDEFAIVAGYTNPVSRDFVILYVDCQRLPRGDQSIAEARFVRAIDAVRQRRLFANIPILMAVENLPGPQGDQAVYMLTQYQNRTKRSLGKILHMAESGADRKYGVLKTNESTERMVRFLSNLMRFNRVHFSEHLAVGEGLQPQQMVDKILQQMSEFRCEMIPNKGNPHSEPKYRWAGKQDDALVAVMMNPFWSAFMEDSDYVVYKKWRETL